MTAVAEAVPAARRGSRGQQDDEAWTAPCGRCGGLNGACFLTCPTLRLAPGWYDRLPIEPYEQLTPNQRAMLLVLAAAGGKHQEDLLGPLLPKRSMAGIRRTAVSLAMRDLAERTGGVVMLTEAGRTAAAGLQDGRSR